MATAPTTYYGETPVYCEMKRLSIDMDSANAAGTYTASFSLPKDSMVLDVGMHAESLWNAGTSATGKCGDGDDDDGYFTGVNLKATDLLAGESINLVAHGGKAGAYVVGTLPTGHWEARYNTAAKTVSFVITTVGTAPTTGSTVCWVKWARMPEQIGLQLGTYAAT